MRLAYLIAFLFSLMFNALALETVIFKYDANGEYTMESLSGDYCECNSNYYPQAFDY